MERKLWRGFGRLGVAQGTGYIGWAVAGAFQSPFAVGGAQWHNPYYTAPVDTVHLGCWPRDVFDRIGFFDEELVRNQDDEFNLWLSRAGGRSGGAAQCTPSVHRTAGERCLLTEARALHPQLTATRSSWSTARENW